MKKDVDFKSTPDRSPGFLLWHISTAWRSSIERLLKPIGLTHPQFVVLASLGWLTQKGDRVTQAAIGTMAGLDPNTISQILKGLELKKLITREQSSDARAKNPILTATGNALLGQALPTVESIDAQFFNSLNHKEMEEMMRAFQKLIT